MDRTEPITSTHINQIGCRLSLPVSGTFELTARCNFNCRMCYVHRKDDAAELMKQELTAEQWLHIAKKARDMGLIFLLLTGGEPFLREDFPYLYEQLIKLGFVVSINTNASLYNDRLSELFAAYPPSRINVTLYGGSEETYKRLCGNASFEKVVSNLRRMKAEGLPVRLNVSLTPYNAGDMEKIHAISQELQLHAKASAYMYPQVRVNDGRSENAGRFSPEEAGRVTARWYRLRDGREVFAQKAAALRAGLAVPEDDVCAEPEAMGVMCRGGRSAFWICWNGKMMPCGTMSVDGPNVKETDFAQAWAEVAEFTRSIRLPVECAACARRKSCAVCASICKGETGDFGGRPEYMCRLQRAKEEEILRIAETEKDYEDKA